MAFFGLNVPRGTSHPDFRRDIPRGTSHPISYVLRGTLHPSFVSIVPRGTMPPGLYLSLEVFRFAAMVSSVNRYIPAVLSCLALSKYMVQTFDKLVQAKLRKG